MTPRRDPALRARVLNVLNQYDTDDLEANVSKILMGCASSVLTQYKRGNIDRDQARDILSAAFQYFRMTIMASIGIEMVKNNATPEDHIYLAAKALTEREPMRQRLANLIELLQIEDGEEETDQ